MTGGGSCRGRVRVTGGQGLGGICVLVFMEDDKPRAKQGSCAGHEGVGMKAEAKLRELLAG